MAMFYGNNVTNYAVQGRINVLNSAWKALQVGSSPHSGRFAIRLSSKGLPVQALALTYVNRNADGTFTAPTTAAKDCTIYPGGRTWIEPLSDKVTLYGKLINKGGSSLGSVEIIVTEFS